MFGHRACLSLTNRFKCCALGAVVAHEDDESIVILSCLFEIVDNLADVVIDGIDHARISLHCAARKFPLRLGHIVPKRRSHVDHFVRYDVC